MHGSHGILWIISVGGIIVGECLGRNRQNNPTYHDTHKTENFFDISI
jgi:hypothetical protein